MTTYVGENAILRTARKTYRCIAADDVLGWRVTARWAHGRASGESTGGRYDTEPEAQAAAAQKVGQVAAWNMHLEPPEPSAYYDSAEAVPIRNRNAASRAPDCRGDINPGDQYVEYVGDVVYGSGSRYCLPCGQTTWGDR